MKKIFLFLNLLIAAHSFATVRTVSNNPSTLAQFNTIQAAVDASVSGDTVYVHGSNTAYAAFTILDKRLTVIGPGWAPIKNFAPFRAMVNSITIQGPGSDYTEIQGLVIVTTVNSSFNHSNHLRFYRNEFNSSVNLGQNMNSYTGYIFQGNFFNNAGIVATPSTTYSNFLIQNNVFYNVSSSNGNIYGMTISQNVVIDHNLWYGPSTGSSPAFGGDCRFLTITNNVFVKRDASVNNTTSVFNNNITYNCVVNNPWALNGNSSASINIENQDPQLADQVAVNAGTNNPLLNFTIAAGPANNIGTDGKDLGLLYDPTGSVNWANSRMSRIPYMFRMDISNPTVAPGGILNVQVEARKSN